METTKYGVTGATGQLGEKVIAHLKTLISENQIVALVRSPEKAKSLAVEARPFDYTNEDQLTQSLKGIDRLLLISSNEIGQRAKQHANVIQAAKDAGVKHIVYTSLLHANTSTLNLAPEHVETEKVLKDSGIPYTILRNGWYTENYTGSIAGALSAGGFIGSAGDGKIASAARQDYAEAAAIVLTSEGHENKTYELAGDTAYTLQDLASEISRQVEKEIPYNNLPEEEYKGILSSVGLPEALSASIASWDVAASKGDLYDDNKTLSELIGHPTTPLSETVKAAL